LNGAGLVEDVERVLAETGLDPRCLKLEVTEGSIMKDPETALATLRRLKLLNVGLELDDFGTGYSSLSYLQRLPFDTVKIDRSFIRELGVNAESSEIVRTIVELARSLEMEVVAEGVETEYQFQKVSSLGCEYVQGYYFAKPAPAQATEALINERCELQRAFEMLQGADSGFATCLEPCSLPMTDSSTAGSRCDARLTTVSDFTMIGDSVQ
jgi:EAL domain-containing protein (putative c-di-GMP-specific phosphodiesterase class I)